MAIIQKLTRIPTPEERRIFLNEVKPELTLCERLFNFTRSGTSDAQREALSLLLEDNDDQAVTDHLQEIKLPKTISVGHGFLIGILTWMNCVPAIFVERCLNPNEIGQTFAGNHLENWKHNLDKAKEWLTNDNQLGELEEKFIASLKASQDMRAFWNVCHSLSEEERELLNQHAIQYQT